MATIDGMFGKSQPSKGEYAPLKGFAGDAGDRPKNWMV